MDYWVYALQKSSDGSLFLPFLHYDSYQEVSRYGRAFPKLSSCCRKRPGRRGRAGGSARRPAGDPAPIIKLSAAL